MINVLIVQGKQVDGIVGMASHIIIISDKFYNSLPNKPVKLDEFTLFTADTYMSMKGYLLEPTEIKISDLLFTGRSGSVVELPPCDREVVSLSPARAGCVKHKTVKIGSDCFFARSTAFRRYNHGSFGYDLKNGGPVSQ